MGMDAKLPINQIICGDCLEVMADWPDGCVDLVLTDPPYGVGFEYDIYEDTVDAWNKLMGTVIPELRRISQMVILPSCRIRALPRIYANYPPDWLICWHKGSPGTAAHIGFNDWEPLLVYGKRKGICMHDHFYCAPVPFENGHPCPKPYSWARWLAMRASRPNDLILDPFCGSGTTCVAAKKLGRRYIGIDISSEYCEIARKRLEAVDSGVPVKEAQRGQMAMKTLYE
jgi:site-specific DNA-methyltransferase (adenine-specific)